MRRKSDMWQELDDRSFLPAEGAQAAHDAASSVQDRLAMLEKQLRSQFTSMSTYHQMSLQSCETIRAEARADLDREKATLVSLLERVRNECAGEAVRVVVPATPEPKPPEHAPEPAINVSALARIALLEDRFEQFGQQLALCLTSQQELANSIAFMFEQQVRQAALVGSSAGGGRG